VFWCVFFLFVKHSLTSRLIYTPLEHRRGGLLLDAFPQISSRINPKYPNQSVIRMIRADVLRTWQPLNDWWMWWADEMKPPNPSASFLDHPSSVVHSAVSCCLLCYLPPILNTYSHHYQASWRIGVYCKIVSSNSSQQNITHRAF
jgi:hypothetical protein